MSSPGSRMLMRTVAGAETFLASSVTVKVKLSSPTLFLRAYRQRFRRDSARPCRAWAHRQAERSATHAPGRRRSGGRRWQCSGRSPAHNSPPSGARFCRTGCVRSGRPPRPARDRRSADSAERRRSFRRRPAAAADAPARRWAARPRLQHTAAQPDLRDLGAGTAVTKMPFSAESCGASKSASEKQ